MIKMKFSNDPKVELVSIDEFLERVDYFCDVSEDEIWNDQTIPKGENTYYKITSKYLIRISYMLSPINYGMSYRSILDSIMVAYRDGKTEYELFSKRIINLQKEKACGKREALTRAKGLFPEYNNQTNSVSESFEQHLINTGYKTDKESLKNKYLVFDVETNGLRKVNDDLLSLSIYDPTTGVCYNRFFPLDLQPMVLTTHINGITDQTLDKKTHITQEEWDWLCETFNFKDKIFLSYSGGRGEFDASFLKNYLKRQGIIGYAGLCFENIKNKLPTAPWGCEGELTKDNLCRIFGIEGVNNIHTSYNDCILEWKLFEKLDSESFIFIGRHLYKYNSGYIVPISYLDRYPDLKRYAKITVPHIEGRAEKLLQYRFDKDLLREIKKFPTNITGIAIENAINSYLHAEKEDNKKFLTENKSHLTYIGSLDSNIREIPIILENDGTIKAVLEGDKEYVDNVNEVTIKIMEKIKPMADYIKTTIFQDEKVKTQEISVTEDKKVLALCDLSNSQNVLEIKTYESVGEDGGVAKHVAEQLYYQSQGRKTYLLSIIFEKRDSAREGIYVHRLDVKLYKVDLLVCDPSSVVYTRELEEIEIRILKKIEKDATVSKTRLSRMLDVTLKAVNFLTNRLVKFGYIEQCKPGRVNCWVLLRSPEDKITKYRENEGEIIVIKED